MNQIFNLVMICLFIFYGAITSYIDFKTKKVITLYNYIYLFLSLILIGFYLFFSSEIDFSLTVKKIIFSTLVYGIIITLLFYILGIGAGDSEFLWIITPTMLFLENFNTYKLIQIYLGQLWFACLLVIAFKVINKIVSYFLSQKKDDSCNDLNKSEKSINSKFAFIPYLFIGSLLSIYFF